MIPADQLRSLRNDVPVLVAIFHLRIPTRMCRMRLTFRCPACGGFDTAVNSRANLARCFRCERNFNSIDLIMAEQNSSFLEAVRAVKALRASRPEAGFSSCDPRDGPSFNIQSRLSGLRRRSKPSVSEEAGSQLPQVGGKEIQQQTTDWPPPPKGADFFTRDVEV